MYSANPLKHAVKSHLPVFTEPAAAILDLMIRANTWYVR